MRGTFGAIVLIVVGGVALAHNLGYLNINPGAPDPHLVAIDPDWAGHRHCLSAGRQQEDAADRCRRA